MAEGEGRNWLVLESVRTASLETKSAEIRSVSRGIISEAVADTTSDLKQSDIKSEAIWKSSSARIGILSVA